MFTDSPYVDFLRNVDAHPTVVEALAECDAIEARRLELQDEANQLSGLLQKMKRDTLVQELSDDAYSRIMQRQDLAAFAVQKASVSSRFREVTRDLQALVLFKDRARHKFDRARALRAPERLKQPDFVEAFRAISDAAERLEDANSAMQRLVSKAIVDEGHSTLLNSDFSGVTIGLRDVAVWRAGAEKLCGASLSAELRAAHG